MKFKIPPIRIDSDDCQVMVGRVIEDGEIVDGGVGHYVHLDEWVEALPVTSMRAWLGLGGAQGADGDDDDAMRTAIVAQNFNDICEALSKQITSWNWTDMVGTALAQPYRNIEVIKDLSTDEVIWLMNAASREATDDLKKDAPSSPNGSTGAVRNQKRSRSGGSVKPSAARPAKP